MYQDISVRLHLINMEFHARALANHINKSFATDKQNVYSTPLLNQIGRENIVVCFLTQDIEQQKKTLSGDNKTG